MRRYLLATAALLISFCLLTPQSMAAQCKNSSQSQCSAAANCTWVSGYKTKNGNQVSAHCRSKGKRQAKNKPKSAASQKKN